jgi:hypothetical protein
MIDMVSVLWVGNPTKTDVIESPCILNEPTYPGIYSVRNPDMKTPPAILDGGFPGKKVVGEGACSVLGGATVCVVAGCVKSDIIMEFIKGNVAEGSGLGSTING